MRVAILADPITNQKAGIHYYTKALVRHLDRLDSEIEYVIVAEKKLKYVKKLRQIVIRNNFFYPYKAFRMFFIIPWVLIANKVDLVVEPAHFGPFNLPKRVKRVNIIHDLTPILFPQFHRFHSQILQRIFLKRILKKADHIITNSAYTTSDVIKYFPFSKDKISYFYPGSDPLMKQIEGGNLNLRYHLPENYFLFVGTIEPRKNLKTLIRAFESFKSEKESDYKLLIVGQIGWKSDHIIKLIERSKVSNEIELRGYVKRKDLPVYFSQARVTILPSIYEGFGLPVLESMSCGTPCIVSNVSSLPEVGADAVLTFSPEDSIELTKKMSEIHTNHKLYQQLKEKSIKRALDFDWKKSAIEFHNILLKIAAEDAGIN